MLHTALNEVTLVVDDGPARSTGLLLSQLEQAGHRAVWFIVGRKVGRFAGSALERLMPSRRKILVDAVRRGFALGNHSFDHPHFSNISVPEARESICRTDRIIEEIYAQAGVRRPGKWFRFPYLDEGGNRAGEFQSLLHDLGFECPPAATERLDPRHRRGLDWPTTLKTSDWELPAEALMRERLSAARPGDVIEIHDRPHLIDRYGRAIVEELAKLSLRATIPASGPVS